MDNPVVEAMVDVLVAAGHVTLRFDFRGVRQSEGTHGKGLTERNDVLAAIDLVETYAPGLPTIAAGYSFGAVMALSASRPSVMRWIAVAPPAAMLHKELAAATDPGRKLIVVPEHDQYSTVAATTSTTAGWPATNVTPLAMADHFMNGRLVVRRAILTAALNDQVS